MKMSKEEFMAKMEQKAGRNYDDVLQSCHKSVSGKIIKGSIN